MAGATLVGLALLAGCGSSSSSTEAPEPVAAVAKVLADLKLTIKLNRRLAAGLDHGSVVELETASPSAAAPTKPNRAARASCVCRS
jgi:hypothetical protein